MRNFAPMQAERIEKFLTDPNRDSFERIAVEAFADAFASDSAVREISQLHGLRSGRIDDWRAIPAIPAPHPEGDGTGRALETDLSRLATESAFRLACMTALARPLILKLAGGDPAAANRAPADPASTDRAAGDRGADERLPAEPASLLFERFGGPGSLDAAASGRVEVNAARSWLAGRQRDGRAALILATDTTLGRLLGTLERQDLRFRLAFGSRVVILSPPRLPSEAGPEPGQASVEAASIDRLGLGIEALVRQYRWPGVATACFGTASPEGHFRLAAPPWLRFSYLEPASGADLKRLTALDLTDSPFRIELDASGAIEDDGAGLALSSA